MYKGGRARNCCTMRNNGKLYLKRANSLRFAGDEGLTCCQTRARLKCERPLLLQLCNV